MEEQSVNQEVQPAEIQLSPEELEALVGPADAHLRTLQQGLSVQITARGGVLLLSGEPMPVSVAQRVIDALLASIRSGRRPSHADVKYAIRILRQDPSADARHLVADPVVITHRGKPVYPKTAGQGVYCRAMVDHELVFCYGPAGSGKTYLAMAQAVADLRDGRISRIVLSRPIMEAGEHLGFLPGDVTEKVDPYLRPLHDALQDIMGAERFRRYSERGTIEVVPLAYMRGRTINDAFMVLDEAQNTTVPQMKMFLTRMGFGSRMIVTGDITQTDLPPGHLSGMRNAIDVLGGVEGIGFVELSGDDIVRHDLVQRIVGAYERSDRARFGAGAEGPPDGQS
jgi:phosphate starvation-inducible PhoH-like protein